MSKNEEKGKNPWIWTTVRLLPGGVGQLKVEEGVGVINVGGGRIDLHGEHTTSCIGDVLRNCAPESCIILLTSVTPINPIKMTTKNEALS